MIREAVGIGLALVILAGLTLAGWFIGQAIGRALLHVDVISALLFGLTGFGLGVAVMWGWRR